MTLPARILGQPPAEVYYPSEDEEPTGETDWHMIALLLLREALEDWYASKPDVYVASDMFVYFVEGNPAIRRCPDVMVIQGVERKMRRVFKVWEEKTAPAVVFEILSDGTWRTDLHQKWSDYATLGVREYYLFDPHDEYMQPALRGFRLVGGIYEELPHGPGSSLVSQEMGLRLRPEGHMLRLIDLATNVPVLTRAERAERERQLREQEQRLREQEQRLREQLGLELEQERRQAEQLRLQAEHDRRQAEQERQRAEALAAEVARLRALLPPDQGTQG